jgi:hypothetical protein
VTATAGLQAAALAGERFVAFSLFGEPAPYAPEPEPAGEDPAADAAWPDQLALPLDAPAHQPSIWDAEPEPRQLALLPEPEPWEAERAPAPRRQPAGRLARRRALAVAGPDQLPLF